MILKTLNPFIDSQKSLDKTGEAVGLQELIKGDTKAKSAEHIDDFAALLKVKTENEISSVDENGNINKKENTESISKLLTKNSDDSTSPDKANLKVSNQNEFSKIVMSKDPKSNANTNTSVDMGTATNEISEKLKMSGSPKEAIDQKQIDKSILDVLSKEVTSGTTSKVIKKNDVVNKNNKLQDIFAKLDIENPKEQSEVFESKDFFPKVNQKNIKNNNLQEMTPKELQAFQISQQNDLGINKKDKSKVQKFNLDLPVEMESNRPLRKKVGQNTYAKEFAAQNNSLIKGPVSSELIENKKMIDSDGISNIHKSVEQNVSFDSLPQTDFDDVKVTNKMTTVDLSHINVSSKEELINEVSNYIQRAYVSGQDKLDVIVKHDDLGDFQITAQRLDKGGEVSLEIQTKLENGHDFFTQNESDLVKTLQNNGVKVSSLKIAHKSEISLTMETGKSFTGEQPSDSSSNHKSGGEQRQQGSNTDSSGQRQERRRQLWQEAGQYREQLAA